MLRCLNACSLKGVYVTGVVYRNPDLDDIQIFYDITVLHTGISCESDKSIKCWDFIYK